MSPNPSTQASPWWSRGQHGRPKLPGNGSCGIVVRVDAGDSDRAGEPDDLIEAGSERRALLAARWQRHPASRVILALAVLALAVAAVVTATGRPDRRPQAGRPSPSPSSSAGSAPVAATAAADDSLYAVPAGDLRTVLAERGCRTGCRAQSLFGPALARAAAAFPGMTPVAGGSVTGSGSKVIFQSVEGRAAPDALVHLVLRRVDGDRAGDRAGPTVRDQVVDGARTVTIRQRRGGWQLTATVLVRGSVPPRRAALAWSATTTLPD